MSFLSRQREGWAGKSPQVSSRPRRHYASRQHTPTTGRGPLIHTAVLSTPFPAPTGRLLELQVHHHVGTSPAERRARCDHRPAQPRRRGLVLPSSWVAAPAVYLVSRCTAVCQQYTEQKGAVRDGSLGTEGTPSWQARSRATRESTARTLIAAEGHAARLSLPHIRRGGRSS